MTRRSMQYSAYLPIKQHSQQAVIKRQLTSFKKKPCNKDEWSESRNFRHSSPYSSSNTLKSCKFK